MLSSVYAISYKENTTVERDLVVAPDILSAIQLYHKTYPARLVLSVIYISIILV